MRYLKPKEINKEKWDQTVQNSPIENIFSYSWYLDAISEKWGALIDDEYTTIFPIAYSKKLNHKYAFQPIFSREFEIIGKNFKLNDVLSFMQEKFQFVHFRNSQFKSNDKRVYQYINLKDDESWSTNAKRLYKKGKKLYTLEESENIDDLVKIFANTALPKIDTLKGSDLIALKKLMQAALDNNKGKLRIIKNEKGEMVGGGFFFYDKKRVTLLKSACIDKDKKNGAVYFLIGEEIKNAAKSYETFDFGGSNEKNVRQFYNKFGATDQTYFEIIIGKQPLWLKLAKRVFK